MRRHALHKIALVGFLMSALPATAGTWVAAVPVQGSVSMTLFGINDHNVVTGAYVDSSGKQHGFFGPFDGSNYVSFDDPDGSTEPRGIDDKTDITGYDTGTLVPWERFPDGTLTVITKGGVPLNQIAQGLNKNRQFAGNYLDKNGVSVGYWGKRARYSGQVSLGFQNAGVGARAINVAGVIGGWYYDSNFVQHGFLWLGGSVATIDYPHAVYTIVEGLNDKEWVSGQYQDAHGVMHGFLFNRNSGKFKSLDAPGASVTQAWGISDSDVVAVSSDVGSFVYCIKAKPCPSAPAGVSNRGKQALRNFVPAQP